MRTLLTTKLILLCFITFAQSKKGITEYEKGQKAYQSENFSEAFKWYDLSAQKGNADAMFELGNLYYDGLGAPQDDTKAYNWYKRAAEMGQTDAMLTIGYWYANGIHVELDYKQTEKWYLKAANLNNAKAMRYLGNLYYHGEEGIEKDLAKAKIWFTKAAEHGDSEASSILMDLGWD
jgi:TPR repeat protein